ncbi:MAG TPA: hypothetical protein V6C84_11235 [Coleofasciculaceae cyanobacterium]|jgi:hypothetical protein
MSQSRWRQALDRLKLGFWLPLLLVGLLFFWGTSWVTASVTSWAYETTAQLQTDEQPEVQLSFSVRIAAIDAEINRRTEITEVTVRTTDSILQELELDLQVTEFAQVEDALMQELGLTRDAVKRLTRYRVD